MDNKTLTPYVARPLDKEGNALYTPEDHQVWSILSKRQQSILKNRACNDYLQGLALLNLPLDRIPQCHEVSAKLAKATGFSLAPVPALIPFKTFFQLLSERKFPAATFIRSPQELDYLKEPDIFHEIFGHCPLLMNQACADFTAKYGELALCAPKEALPFLARLYWFTIEFGLMQTKEGIRAFGGGIMSSYQELQYAIDSPIPKKVPFDLVACLRTPYRIDILQPIYYILPDFNELYQLLTSDLLSIIQKARALGLYAPLYQQSEGKNE